MDDTVCIEQQGTVEEVRGHKVYVRVSQLSACAKCHARSLCSITDMKDKLIEVRDTVPGITAGDRVDVVMKRSMGNKAVLLGYVVPFILLVTILLVMNSLVSKEWIAGIISIAALIPYYYILYLSRERLRNTFTFTLRKLG